MAKSSFNFFINNFKSIFDCYNLEKENDNKKIISSVSDYYMKFIFNLNDRLDEERNNNNYLKDQLEQERIINNDLREQINNLKSKLEKCSICLENDRSICCIPCGHIYCHKCIITAKKCFICRKKIICINKIYL